jgi:hypothetical protein
VAHTTHDGKNILKGTNEQDGRVRLRFPAVSDEKRTQKRTGYENGGIDRLMVKEMESPLSELGPTFAVNNKEKIFFRPFELLTCETGDVMILPF